MRTAQKLHSPLMRLAVILIRLLAHMLLGLLLILVLWPMLSSASRSQFERWFARRLLAILHIRLVVECQGPQADYGQHGPCLIYANHVSWLDIFALNAHAPITFIAKAEIADWPLAGVLATRSGTLFIERGKRHAVRQVIDQAVQVMGTGRSVAVFPEGTTGPGDQALHFHSNFVQPAMLAKVPVIPVSIQYRDAEGRFSSDPAYLGEQTLLQNIAVLAKAAQGYAVHLTFHTPILPLADDTRHAISDRAHAAIQSALSVGSQNAARSTGA